MRLAELSEHSGVSVATIKYYLREQLLPPGHRVTATQATYGEHHLRRLRLVRALIQIGRMPVATAREVLSAVEDNDLDQHHRLGAAMYALPYGTRVDLDDDQATMAATRAVQLLMVRLGWHSLKTPVSPPHRMLISAVAALIRLGYPCEVDDLLPYGRLAAELSVHDLDRLEDYPSATERVEAAVALTVLYEPVLLSLRRLAHAAESARRFSTT